MVVTTPGCTPCPPRQEELWPTEWPTSLPVAGNLPLVDNATHFKISTGKHRDPGRVEYTVQTFHHGVAEGREEGLDRETLMAQM